MSEPEPSLVKYINFGDFNTQWDAPALLEKWLTG